MNKPEPVYLLLGPEEGKKNAFVAEIREALTRLLGEPPEEYHYYLFETPMRDVVSLLRNASLFAPQKLVICRGAEEVKKKDDISLLAEYAKKPAADGVLILETAETRIEKKIEDAAGSIGKKIFWELFESDKKSWVVNYFRSRKTHITSEAVELFLELVENTTQEMEREARSLTFFLGENAEVTEKDVETYLYHSKQETVFTLFDAICRRNIEAAFEILTKLLREGEDNPIPVLTSQFRTLLSFSLLLGQNYSVEDASGSLKISGKRRQKTFTDGAHSYTTQELQHIMLLCAGFDEKLRSGMNDIHNRLVEFFLYSVMALKGGNFLQV
ncbi:MAG: DNA polymerase III subunit delta [Spirochaetales bacterium]|jgi:DNA polymerase-3 subunit delta|nr:DNA polymerase III subunit delta [Spirochaetales bacterium]